ncbi:hypothetical protein Tco_0065102 [Tanacetum coccineum]
MSTLNFHDTHNMVVFLEKTVESAGFEEIIDFLNASSIRYALTINPTIYTTCVKQFWLLLRKSKNTEVPQLNGSTDDQADENVTQTSNDPLLSGEDRLKFVELMDLCTKLSERVLDLENTKASQDSEITKLKMRGRNNDNLMFDTCVLDEKEVKVEKIKADKPKDVTTAATTITTAVTRPKARRAKDKGKAKVVEPEVPLNKKDQKRLDMEVVAKQQAEFDEEERLQARKQGELTEEEKSRLFMQLLEKGRKHFAALRTSEKRNKPQTQAQQRKLYCNYLKNIEGYTLKQLKGFNLKLSGTCLTKILERADGISKRYSSMIQSIDREELEALWKLVKTKYGLTRLEEAHERVLWDYLKAMFEPDIESEVWRNLQRHKVTVWKLFCSCRVHFVRFSNLHIFMLVEKRYPLTPATITDMFNKKLQADHRSDMCYHLLKLLTK